ncbi:MAG: UDP-4-amino-4,6-dideoxy-N-acetyl-beta-L-altrosamine transaminase [Candidatus Firestonebacteria bacterium]|nr:UDP-4-amino-4,6-dideoxy-N-acetyl-beta-L-altrosamine transaminase [Candidatus Firestonebacteria bacterium]
MNTKKFVPYSRQYIDSDDINEVVEVLKSDWLTQGPKISEFEKKLSEYCGAKYAVVFNSGTSSLHGAYFASGLAEGDEFITTPNTFIATSNVGLYLNAVPVFVDIESDTGNINASLIEQKITNKTKLIIPVHFAGHPVELEKIYNLANRYNIKVIEDACHAQGAKYKDEIIGNCKYSDMAVFSFHPAKHITTGEGGAVLTNSKDYYEKLLMFRTHGITREHFFSKPDGLWYYEMQDLGYNYRLTDIQAALGISQLKKLDGFVKRRRDISEIYNKIFDKNSCFDIPVEKEYAYSSYHLYTIKLKDEYINKKAEIFSRMREEGLGVQVHYIPVHLHPYYKGLGFEKGTYPKAEGHYQRVISIPLYPSMNNEDIDYVIEKINYVFDNV